MKWAHDLVKNLAAKPNKREADHRTKETHDLVNYGSRSKEKGEAMVSAKRPWGVSFMAVLYFVNVGSYVVLLGLAVAAPATLRSLLSTLSPQDSGPAFLLNLGPMLVVYFTVMIVVTGLLGYGMWTLRNWARLVTAIMTAISLIVGVIFLARTASQINLSTLLLDLLRFGLCLLVLWYLWRPNVRAAFRSRSIKEVNS